MASLLTSLLLVLVVVAGCTMSSADARRSRSREKYLELKFYVFNRLLLPNASAFFVVQPLAGLGPNAMSPFGGIVVADDLLTVGPDPNSKSIGRAKGLYVFDTIESNDPGYELLTTAIFNEASGFPAGTTLSYRGFGSISQPVIENSIVGGTGFFRLARGWSDSNLLDASQGLLNITNYIYYGGYP